MRAKLAEIAADPPDRRLGLNADATEEVFREKMAEVAARDPEGSDLGTVELDVGMMENVWSMTYLRDTRARIFADCSK